MINNAVQAAALADRKAKLLLDGEAYRVGIVHAKASVGHGFGVESLIHSVVKHALGFAGAGLEAVLAPTGGRFQALMPLAVLACSWLSRKKILKPAIGAGLVVVTVAALAGRFNRSGSRS
ncbi:MAG: hypothetical protein V7642_2165 [Burkholderiales bacterium]|jgi:hypothetical protein